MITMSGWIPFDERTPGQIKDKDFGADEYIVTIKGATQATALFWTGEDWRDIGYVFDDCCPTYDVVAWMPFPKVWKENN